MTRVDFYTYAENKALVACQVAGKAYRRGLRVVIYAPDAASAASLDAMLWTTPALAFVPHCHPRHCLAAETPVLIAHEPHDFVHDDVLVNLQDECPGFFSRFERLIEIVTRDEADMQRARERYRYYQRRGYSLETTDLRQAQGDK